ncbi:MAG: hypothetical protein GKS01_07050 [Alphaproteobacteria bacterium]|nr:hypothetical protein [Alphaproteobacteria bacterium]
MALSAPGIVFIGSSIPHLTPHDRPYKRSDFVGSNADVIDPSFVGAGPQA